MKEPTQIALIQPDRARNMHSSCNSRGPTQRGCNMDSRPTKKMNGEIGAKVMPMKNASWMIIDLRTVYSDAIAAFLKDLSYSIENESLCETDLQF